MKLSLINWFSTNFHQIVYVFRIILTVSFIFLAFSILILVLLQRGEEGAFSKNKGDKNTADNKTLFRGTVVSSVLFFLNAVCLTGLIYYEKHHISKNKNIVAIEKEIQEQISLTNHKVVEKK